jgi:cob(I)alamin adenosyltransferase
MTASKRPSKRAAPQKAPPERAWSPLHFQRTFSWDAVIILIATIATAVGSSITFINRVNEQQVEIQGIQKSLDTAQADLQARIVQTDQIEKERADRLEAAIRDQNQLLQQLIIPRLQR